MTKNINPDYPYTIEQQGEVQSFTYRKTMLSYQAVIPLAFYFAFPCIFLASALKCHDFMTSFYWWLFFTIGFAFLLVFLINLFKTKKGSFTISKEAISIDGKNYDMAHVKSIGIKDPWDDDSDEVVFTSGLRGVSYSLGNSLKKNTRQTQFAIVLRYATKKIKIAKGLNEQDAEALFDKVTEVTGFTKSV
ncbi:hypothetical protein [Sphingobacterium siyangense]|uniref:hypothetical protein n=1 Tax=Sphingobacterium siyangense TaxID=459529 RepID=UPI003DA36917